MNSFQLYRTWYPRLAQLIPDNCPSRLSNLTWLIVGVYQAMQVYLSAIVRKWALPAKNQSLVRRLTRFLDNPKVQVRVWYEPVAKGLVQKFAATELRLIIDGSKVGWGHQLLVVAIAYHHRALPLVWTWVKGTRGHSSANTQLALLKAVHNLLPAQTRVVLVGDAEFGSISVMRQLRRWRWFYVLRQKSNHLVRRKGQREWQSFGSLVQQPKQVVWWEAAVLTHHWQASMSLLAYWGKGEKEPWLLATNLPEAQDVRQAYQRRMWIEGMFGDWKGHGFDVEATRLRHVRRLSRLVLAICLLYVWLLAAGQRALRAGQRSLVDRVDRRDLSLFRIGWSLIEKFLALQDEFTVRFYPLVSGS